MGGKDYYQILGLDKHCSTDDIKKAFRTLAKKYHPDLNKGKKDSEQKFKEINEAYAVLSDPDKRKQYDTFGAEGFGQRYSQEDIFRGADFGSISDILGGLGFGDGIFSRIFGASMGGRGSRGAPRGGFHFSQGFGGMPNTGPFGADPFGRSASGMPHMPEAEMAIPVQEAFAGGERRISLQHPDGQVQQVTLRIPPGVDDGAVVQASPSESSRQRSGQVAIRIRLQDGGPFRLTGRDLTVSVPCSMILMVLGGTIDVPTLDGATRKMKIQPGSQPSARIRVRGQGYGTGNARGDLYVQLVPILPGTLTPKQKELFEKLRETGL